MRRIAQGIKTVFAVIFLRRKLFAVMAIGLMAASLLINVGILTVVTGGLPAEFAVNDGSMELQADLDDPVDQFLDEVFPLYNYPFAWFAFPKTFTIIDQYGLPETVVQPIPLFLNVHYFVDFAPFALLISAYAAMSRHYFSSMRARTNNPVSKSRRGFVAGTTSTIAPGVSSGTTTALTAVAAGICCGGFAVETSVVVLGFAMSAAGFVLLSRLFMLAMAGFLIYGIFRAARRINANCPIPRWEYRRTRPAPRATLSEGMT